MEMAIRGIEILAVKAGGQLCPGTKGKFLLEEAMLQRDVVFITAVGEAGRFLGHICGIKQDLDRQPNNLTAEAIPRWIDGKLFASKGNSRQKLKTLSELFVNRVSFYPPRPIEAFVSRTFDVQKYVKPMLVHMVRNTAFLQEEYVKLSGFKKILMDAVMWATFGLSNRMSTRNFCLSSIEKDLNKDSAVYAVIWDLIAYGGNPIIADCNLKILEDPCWRTLRVLVPTDENLFKLPPNGSLLEKKDVILRSINYILRNEDTLSTANGAEEIRGEDLKRSGHYSPSGIITTKALVKPGSRSRKGFADVSAESQKFTNFKQTVLFLAATFYHIMTEIRSAMNKESALASASDETGNRAGGENSKRLETTKKCTRILLLLSFADDCILRSDFIKDKELEELEDYDLEAYIAYRINGVTRIRFPKKFQSGKSYMSSENLNLVFAVILEVAMSLARLSDSVNVVKELELLIDEIRKIPLRQDKAKEEFMSNTELVTCINQIKSLLRPQDSNFQVASQGPLSSGMCHCNLDHLVSAASEEEEEWIKALINPDEKPIGGSSQIPTEIVELKLHKMINGSNVEFTTASMKLSTSELTAAKLMFKTHRLQGRYVRLGQEGNSTFNLVCDVLDSCFQPATTTVAEESEREIDGESKARQRHRSEFFSALERIAKGCQTMDWSFVAKTEDIPTDQKVMEAISEKVLWKRILENYSKAEEAILPPLLRRLAKAIWNDGTSTSLFLDPVMKDVFGNIKAEITKRGKPDAAFKWFTVNLDTKGTDIVDVFSAAKPDVWVPMANHPQNAQVILEHKKLVYQVKLGQRLSLDRFPSKEGEPEKPIYILGISDTRLDVAFKRHRSIRLPPVSSGEGICFRAPKLKHTGPGQCLASIATERVKLTNSTSPLLKGFSRPSKVQLETGEIFYRRPPKPHRMSMARDESVESIAGNDQMEQDVLVEQQLIRFKQRDNRGERNVFYKNITTISIPGDIENFPKLSAPKIGSLRAETRQPTLAATDQGISPPLTVRASDGRIFLCGKTMPKRIENALKEIDQLKSEIDKDVDQFPEVQDLRNEETNLDLQIADAVFACAVVGDDNDSETIQKLQEHRKTIQQSIASLKMQIIKGEGIYTVKLPSHQQLVRSAATAAEPSHIAGSSKPRKKRRKVEQVHTAEKKEFKISRKEKKILRLREKWDWKNQGVYQEMQEQRQRDQKLISIQLKHRKVQELDERLTRMVRRFHLEVVDLLSRIDTVLLPPFKTNEVIKNGNKLSALGPISKRILQRLAFGSLASRLAHRMNIVGGAVYQPTEEYTTQYRPASGTIRKVGREKSVFDYVNINGKTERIRTLRDDDSCLSLLRLTLGKIERAAQAGTTQLASL
ncbi:hypothetical protein HDU96_011158, partial [Phlyctochytrium bullatum]